ncbi:RNA polymerase-associated protein RapA [Paenibacillus sp. CECT 9249]|uniref:helicase-related protein n=1 Tax=Paenibacillus sp. CECT 9249 TaxID=2845385 RepID=UPI001E4A16DD|nr:helicase-related protein [Paenibacillus sp. CECT 9249]CAH0121371.1 RNA polymerase-associated protein RapA [Paenibacillus sp. CECT 9249]
MKIINNIDSLLGDDLKQEIVEDSKLSIAASCFSIYAYEALKAELEKVDEIRFIFSSPTFVADSFNKEKREFYIPKRSRERSLSGTDFEIRLKNELTLKAVAKECSDWIRRKVSFRSNKTSGSMPGMMNITKDHEPTTYTPIDGFTTVDLGYEKGNAFANLSHKLTDASATKMYIDLFEQIWNDKTKLEDVTDQVIDHITTIYRENSPEFIYYVILYNIFNEFLSDITEDILPNEATGFKETEIWKRLFHFQKDAVLGGINKLEKFNGCILADSVGLGKTFTALGIIKYYELRNKSVLVLCPKKLADNWLTYTQNVENNILYKDRLRYDVLYHTDISRERGSTNGIPLDRLNWGNYDLLVIDESHNFRNNEPKKDKENRYQKLMRKVLKSGVKTKVLMLSATPVNNKFTDLRNQLAFAYEGNPAEINKKLGLDRGINDIFKRAQSAFNEWSNRNVDERTTETLLEMLDFDFFELLDSLTIARSRKHIQKYYDAAEIGEFPNRLPPISKFCDLTDRKDVIGYNEVFRELSRINLGIYAPFKYILSSRMSFYEGLYDTVVESGSFKQMDREGSLQTLMRINLLKRLESSVESFRLTLTKIMTKIEQTLQMIDQFEQNQGTDEVGYTDIDQANLDDDSWLDDEYSIGDAIKINLSDMDILRWKEDLTEDFHTLNGLLLEMNKVTPEHDQKLNTLKSLIDHKIRNPINPDNRKIIIFSAFTDTASYIYQHLSGYVDEQYHIKTAMIIGDANKNTAGLRNEMHTLLTCFSPQSKEKHVTMPHIKGEIDLLIASDCISEGQNLQDCDYLINYDIHWNPVRVIQRFGRIDRIGSQNKEIQMVNFWPNMTLDEYIRLKERVESRMIIMDMTATGEDNVLSNESSDLKYRKQQLQRLQKEVVDLDDMNTGVSITDLGLNDFRMDLVNYVKENGELDTVPNGLHTVVKADRGKDVHPGVIFVLRNINEELNKDQQNRLHPFYLVYMGEQGDVRMNHLDVKKTMDILRAICRGESEPIYDACNSFNEETHDGRDMEKYSLLLEDTIRSIVQVKEESDIDSLFSPGGTTSLLDTIKGLEDFELISFVVIKEVNS